MIQIPLTIIPQVKADSNTWQIDAGNNDCYVYSTTMSLTSGSIYIVFDGYIIKTGWRWTNIVIPQGSTITSAYLEIRAYTTTTTPDADLRIHGEDTDDCTYFSTATNFNARQRTSESITWDYPGTSAGTWYQSPDIKTVIQEIIARDGWESGNDLALLCQQTISSASKNPEVYGFEGGASYSAKLYAEWEPPLRVRTADYGEDDDYLGQIVDDYLNDDYINETVSVINNVTLDCMELEVLNLTYYEDFDDYTEVDGLGRLTHTNVRSIFTNIARSDNDVYLYDDKGTNNLNDWVATYEMYISSITDGTNANKYVFVILGFADNVGDYLDVRGVGDGFVISVHVVLDKGGYFLGIREFDSGVYWNYVDLTEEFNENTIYYMTLEKSDTRVSLVSYTDSARLNMKDNQTITLQSDRRMRYIYCPQSMNTVGAFFATGYVEDLSFGEAIGYNSGYYTTIDMLNEDIAITLLYDADIVANTSMTMEFFNDSNVWVNHNNILGYDTLINGFESIDLRDINSTNNIIRVNMTTTNSSVTPRMNQLRYVTIIGTVENGNGNGVDNTPSIILGIFLILVASGLIYGVIKRR